MVKNNIGLEGIEFVEFATNKPEWMMNLFFEFGFSLLKKHESKNIQYLKQNNIQLLLNSETKLFRW